MTVAEEITGKTIARWRVIGPCVERTGYVVAQCLGCRRRFERAARTIRSGQSTQCRGCATRRTRKTHGRSGSKLAGAWYKLRQSGHHVPRWDDFEAFAEDMAPRPSGMLLYRPDPSQPWGPGNAEWKTRREAARAWGRRGAGWKAKPLQGLGRLQRELLEILLRARRANQGPMRLSVLAGEVERRSSTVAAALAGLETRRLVRRRRGWELDHDGIRRRHALEHAR